MTPDASATFEGSYLGDGSRLPPGARLECKICWYVYDPADGDPVWQVPPGTPFSQLPAHWSCPQCEGPALQFMVLGDAA
jgi:rubredoxin